MNKNILNKAQEDMRSTVVDLELKARYWKAQFDIRQYTLRAKELEAEYTAFLDQEQKDAEAKYEAMQEQLTALRNQEGVEIETPAEETIDA